MPASVILGRSLRARASILAAVCVLTNAIFTPQSTIAAFAEPPGGWLYTFDGSSGGAGTPYSAVSPVGATNNLDGTWDNRNGSDEWAGDPRGGVISASNPAGGVSANNGILTIEDSVTASGTGNSRKIYFSHDLLQEGLTDPNFMDGGVTINFRARLTPASDPLNQGPAKPDGFGIFSDGKGHFGVHQAGSNELISFSLVNKVEETNTSGGTFDFGAAGLAINSRNTTDDLPGANVGITESTNLVRNLVPVSTTSGSTSKAMASMPLLPMALTP